MSQLFGIGAQFDSARDLCEAAKKLRAAGFRRWDVYSPFPIHGIDAIMGFKSSKVSFFSLMGGIGAVIAGFVLIYYTSAVNYPLVVQGKPYFAFEPTFPVMYEIIIMLSAFITVGAALALNLLPQLYHPVFNWDRFSKVTDDGFFAIIEAADPLFDETKTRALLEQIGGKNIELIGN